MRSSSLYRIWRLSLPVIFILVSVHFARDVTQDVFGIEPVLDAFGGITPDLSGFSMIMQHLYIWAAVNTYFAELFLIIAVPLLFSGKHFSRLEACSMFSAAYLLLFAAAELLLSLT